MKELTRGIDVYSASSLKERDRRLREFTGQYSHFAVQKNGRNAWIIYAARQGGYMRWQGIKQSLGLADNSIFLELTVDGLYGFVLHNGVLQEEWARSSTVEFQTIGHYLSAMQMQAEEEGEPGQTLYLANFEPALLDLLPVQLEITEAMRPVTVTLNQKRIEKLAKLRLMTIAEIKKNRSRLSDSLVIAGAVIAMSGAAYWVLSSNDTPPTEVKKPVKRQESPYLGLQRTLTASGVNVKARMVQLYLNLHDLKGLNGWDITEVVLEPDSNSYGLERTWGTWESLKSQVQPKDFFITSFSGKYMISQHVRTNAVMAEAVGIKTSDCIRYINDGIAYFWQDKMAIRETTPTSNNAWVEVPLDITFKDAYPADLDNLGSLINGWPVTFTGLKATVNQDGALSGVLSLKVVGLSPDGSVNKRGS